MNFAKKLKNAEDNIERLAQFFFLLEKEVNMLASEPVVVKVKLCDGGSIPTYANVQDAGADIKSTHSCVIPAHSSRVFDTGVSVEIPEGYEIQVRPRSGLAFKNDITVVNSPGTIDSSFRGEIKVKLINHSDEIVIISQGDRIAQLVVARVARATFEQVDELTASTRGDAGFGSTGA